MLMTDDDLRDALSPLREIEPTDDQVARALAATEPEAATPRAARPSRVLRPALVLGATAVLAVGVAALPGDSSDSPATAGGLLNATAATAAEQRPAPVAAFRWTSIRETLTYRDRARDGRTAETTFTQPIQRWIDRDGTGIERRGAVTDLQRSGDRTLLRLQPRSSGPVGDTTYEKGDSNIRAADVPTDAGDARVYLDERITASYGGREPHREHARWERTTSVVDLLGTAALRPSQRSALWGVLAATEGVESPGVQGDALGRRGTAITIDFPGGFVPSIDGRPTALPEGTLRVVFDPDTAELLESSFLHDGTDGNAGTPDRIEVYERAGWADDAGELPGA